MQTRTDWDQQKNSRFFVRQRRCTRVQEKVAGELLPIIRKNGRYNVFKEGKDAPQKRSCPGSSIRAGRLGPIGCLSTGLAGMMWAIWHILDQ
jgi:hypothetical protein